MLVESEKIGEVIFLFGSYESGGDGTVLGNVKLDHCPEDTMYFAVANETVTGVATVSGSGDVGLKPQGQPFRLDGICYHANQHRQA